MRSNNKFIIVFSFLGLILTGGSNVFAAVPDICAAGGQKGGDLTKNMGVGDAQAWCIDGSRRVSDSVPLYRHFIVNLTNSGYSRDDAAELVNKKAIRIETNHGTGNLDFWASNNNPGSFPHRSHYTDYLNGVYASNVVVYQSMSPGNMESVTVPINEVDDIVRGIRVSVMTPRNETDTAHILDVNGEVPHHENVSIVAYLVDLDSDPTDPTDPTTPEVIPMGNGNPLSNQSGAKDSETFYSVHVHNNPSALVVTTSGGTGDVDVYVKNAMPLPTTSTYDCRGYTAGNAETCTVDNPKSGTNGHYFVMLKGFSAYSGVTVVAEFVAADTDPNTDPDNADGIALNNGNTITVAGAQNEEKKYYIDVPAGASQLEVKTSGGSGDIDFWIKPGSAPTTSDYTCRGYTNGNVATCRQANPAPGRWHILTNGYNPYANVSFTATITGGS